MKSEFNPEKNTMQLSPKTILCFFSVKRQSFKENARVSAQKYTKTEKENKVSRTLKFVYTGGVFSPTFKTKCCAVASPTN